MATVSRLRVLVGGIPTTIDLTASGTALQAYDLQISNPGVTASKPAKLDANKKIVSGNIDLTSEVTGQLPYANMNIANGDLTIAKTSGLQTALDSKIASSEKGVANGVATLGPDGKLPSAQVPALAITETFVVASQSEQVALTAQVGDVAVRTDLNKTFILRVEPATTFSNWTEILNPAAPVQTVNGQTGTVVLGTNDIAETGGVLYFTDARAKAAAVADTITNGVTDIAPSQNAVFDALALKANDADVVKTVNGKTPTAGAVTLNTDDITEGAANKYYTSTRARNDVLTSSISAGDLTHAPTGDVVHAALAQKEKRGFDTFDGVVGEAFAANKTYLVRFAVGSSETSGRVYKATSDVTNHPNCYAACGIIQVGATPLTAGDAVEVMRYAENIMLLENDSVVGSSTSDNGKIVWLNKDGAFGLSPLTGINSGDLFANFMIGVIKNYDALSTNQKMTVDISMGNLTGVDIA